VNLQTFVGSATVAVCRVAALFTCRCVQTPHTTQASFTTNNMIYVTSTAFEQISSEKNQRDDQIMRNVVQFRLLFNKTHALM